ncbi:MAG: hypothetical protein ACRDDF_10690, partial [Aeromonas sp.]
MLKTKNLNSKLLRWAMYLQEYDIKIVYIKGCRNYTDVLSRPLASRSTPKELKIIKKTRVSDRVEEITADKDKYKILACCHLETCHGGYRTMRYLIEKKYKWV